MHVETERLIIDDLRETDKRCYFDNISHDRQVLKTFICRYEEDIESFDFARYLGRNDVFAIRLKDSGDLIGIFVEFKPDDEEDSIEIGYGIGSPHWGKGYVTEATRAMLSYYFTQRKIGRVYASFFPENTASKRVMEKCGMTFSHVHEKELTYLDVERDLVYYKLDAGDAR